MLEKLQWDSLQQRRARSRVLMLYRIRDGLVATLPQSISSQLWFTPEGSKPATDRSSATQACTIKPSFLVQLDYGTPCQLMSASCRLPALAQLNTIQLMQLPTDHIFNCTTALFLSAAVRLPVLNLN